MIHQMICSLASEVCHWVYKLYIKSIYYKVIYIISGLLTSKCSPSSWWLAAEDEDDAEEDPKADPDENEVSW